MKNFALILLCLSLNFGLQAQDDSDNFNRKGKILVETGYNLIAGFSSGTGLSLLVDDDGETFTSLGFDGGYFVSENFALKMKLSLLSSFGSLTNFSVGGKYYAGGRVPIELGAGFLSSGGNSEFLANLSVGYAINLADNIALEPNIGGFTSGDGALLEFGLTFSMFL